MASLNISDSFISNSSIDETAWNFQVSGNWIKVKAMFTVYRIACAPPRKPYRIGLLFKRKNGCGGVISETERLAVPRRSPKCRVTCWIHVGVHTLYRIASRGAMKRYPAVQCEHSLKHISASIYVVYCWIFRRVGGGVRGVRTNPLCRSMMED